MSLRGSSNTLAVISIITVTGIFFSCGDSPKKTDEKPTIRFWNFWSEPQQRSIIKKIVSEFETNHNCIVEITELSWGEGKTKLQYAFNSGTEPDVIELGSDWVAQFSSSGRLSELNADSMNITRFVPFSHAPTKWNGRLFALPWIVDSRVLYFNKTLLRNSGVGETPPTTIEQLQEMAGKIEALPGDYYGIGINGSDENRLYKKLVTMFWSNGGSLENERGEIQFASDLNAQALEKYVELSNLGIIETQKHIEPLFTQGKIGFWISGSWLLDKIKKDNPALDFGVALCPGMNGNEGIAFAGGEYLAVTKKSPNQKLAKEFIRYMTDGVTAMGFCKSISDAGYPADQRYFNDPYFNSKPERKILIDQLNHARMTPVNPRWLVAQEAIEKAAVECLYGRSDAKSALVRAQERFNQESAH